MRQKVKIYLLGITFVVPILSYGYKSQLNLGLDIGYSGFFTSQNKGHGLSGGLHGSYGLTDSLAIYGRTFFDFLYSFDEEKYIKGYLVSAEGGVYYALDILRVIPFASIGIGWIWALNNAFFLSKKHDLSISIGGGFDYLFSRNFSIGIEIKGYTLILNSVNFQYIKASTRINLLYDL